jgi:glycosyltransferase involved in cell wall biosynthesis
MHPCYNSKLLKIAFFTTDNREHHSRYDMAEPYFGTAPEALLQGFTAVPEAEVHVITCTQRPMKSPEKLADNIWFHSLLVPKIGWLRTGYQGCIRATRKFLRELRPDIVHGQGTERECAISAAFSGFPNVVTIHGNMRLVATVTGARPFSFQWLAARLETLTIPRSDGVVCITHYTQDAVRDLARKTWVVPNAVDPSFFEVRRAAETEPMILVLGYVTLRKNQNAFIRALDPLIERMPFKVVFLGYASQQCTYGAEFFDLIKTRPWCEHAGFVDRNAVKKRLATAQLLVMPSLEENCPMAVLESMAAGVPVVAAKVGGVPDLVEETVNGIFCDPTDAKSMREAVARALENPQSAQAMAETAKCQALERFHPRVIAQRHVAIYDEVFSKRS